MITVLFPAALHELAGVSLHVHDAVTTVGQLIEAVDRLKPGVAKALDDPMFNVAVNDEIVLHGVDACGVKDGDVVEVIPSMAGG